MTRTKKFGKLRKAEFFFGSLLFIASADRAIECWELSKTNLPQLDSIRQFPPIWPWPERVDLCNLGTEKISICFVLLPRTTRPFLRELCLKSKKNSTSKRNENKIGDNCSNKYTIAFSQYPFCFRPRFSILQIRRKKLDSKSSEKELSWRQSRSKI